MLKQICGLTVENILLCQYRKKPNVDGSYGADIWSMLAIADCKICHNLVSDHSFEIVEKSGTLFRESSIVDIMIPFLSASDEDKSKS